MAKRNKQDKRKKQKSQPRARMAKSADKYALYQESVQDPPEDARLLARIFKQRFDRPAAVMREDFCGTAALSCAWVEGGAERRAVGVDIDAEPLAWSREHNLAALNDEQAARVELVESDVLDDDPVEPADILCAFNFSYFCFHERAVLRRYFERSLARIRPEGLFFLDLYGGADAQRTMTETRDHEGFDYVWDQDVFDPINHRATNYIHFEFPDGSRMRKAFRYDWRLWTIPELRDLLHEVGFGDVTVLWEGTDRATNEGNGIYRPATRAADDPAWVSYIVAAK